MTFAIASLYKGSLSIPGDIMTTCSEIFKNLIIKETKKLKDSSVPIENFISKYKEEWNSQ